MKISNFIAIFAIIFFFKISVIQAAPGNLDLTFGDGGKVITDISTDLDDASHILVQPDNKIISIGYATNTNTFGIDFALARYNPDGSLDQSFGSGGKVTTGFSSNIAFALSGNLQNDGKIVAVGYYSLGFTIVRYNTNGSLDTTFDSDGISTVSFNNGVGNVSGWSSAIQPDGKIIAAGSVRSGSNYDFALLRCNPDGSLDSSFGNGGRVITSFSSLRDEIRSIALQSNGKIVAAGYANNGTNSDFAIARYNTDGSLDTSFDGDGRVTLAIGNSADFAYSMAVQNDGKLILAGESYNGVNYDCAAARFDSNGSLDSSFGSNGVVLTAFGTSGDDGAYSVGVQQNGKIVVGGYTGNMPNRNFALARYESSGVLDTTFNGNGKVVSDFGNTDEAVTNLKFQRDGKIVVSGFRVTQNNSSTGTFIAARYEGDAVTIQYKTPFDFDGDGKSDVSVFRPDNGAWYIQQSQNGFVGLQFGIASDTLVPADYDGDGKTDLAVVRNGVWYLQRSQLGFTSIQFGTSDDIPVPGDYDGDGKADLAVFRPSSGTWYLQRSQLGFAGVQFGQNGDNPLTGDYDGDGKADLAVNRSGIWYINRSQLGFYGVQFGDSNDNLVPADYDGDGKTDVAVFRPSNSVWYLQQSTAGFAGVAFGLGTDVPVAADYDGDGKADVAVVRNGVWYLNRTMQGFTSVSFGTATDKPIPNAFVR